MNEIKEFNELYEALENKNIINAYGIVDKATGHFIYKLFNDIKRPVFVLCENNLKAKNLYDSLKNYNLKIDYFPELETNFQILEDLDYTNRSYRLKTIKNILDRNYGVIISTFSGIKRKISSKDNFIESIYKIDKDDEIDLDNLINRLIELGYSRRDLVESRGDFSVRGDIIDIFQISDDNPTRLELFDVEIDSIRKFNVNTQLSIESIDKLDIYPIYENKFDKENISKIIKSINEDLDKTRKKFGDVIYDKALFKYSKIIEKLEDEKYIDNIDLIIPYLSDNNSNILEFLPDDSLILLDDFSTIEDKYETIEKVEYEDLVFKFSNGIILNSHQKLFFDLNELINYILKYKIVNISSLLKTTKRIKPDYLLEFYTREGLSYHGKFDDFINDIKYDLSNGYKINIFVDNKKEANDLSKSLFEYDIDNNIIQSKDNQSKDNQSIDKKIDIYINYLKDGFEYYKDKIKYITYYEIFNKKRKQKSKTVKNKDIINYSDLVHGDLLVHDNYGIGEFIGIKNIELNNIKSDFIELRYFDNDKLFVPTSDMSMVSKFIGNGDRKPKLSKLGGSDWNKAKHKAKKAIDEIAEDLVKLYAKRSEIKGFKFSSDTPWQKEFEDQFEYQETNSQLKAIREIKDDMESSKVMDRLLCGDVGYGKTEVALRAAFKAIMDGKQVVMLAPTTILVKQHFNTMKDRFKNFPVNIDFLSRFKTPKQKNEVMEKLKSGELDFVVGTHALLADKISFNNLGLLIVDEEQRFGVRHKEKIKKMTENIDVLTLSATPIPRTLQMSLSGIRDLSLLDEYPQNRLPVNTYVMEYDPVYIRDAILKEISRNGQIYFVYNKVNSINRMYERLNELVPEASIVVSHGRMKTRELENILDDFTNNKYDILLTTTIIETGMDIQNVNTIIVYNSDMMGLSQLYQLKGRVGRSDRNSYAYFTYKPNKVMTEISEKRLKAIKDFTELGSGYKVAMRDLELRGAGNLLGESQSGHIESIGYDLFIRMLKETIDNIKGVKTKQVDENIKIDLNVDVYIPKEYISSENEKINIYKKISSIENKEDHYNIIDELTDRFGDIPNSVQNIIDIAYIKSMIIENNFLEIEEVEENVIIRYNDLDVFDFDKLQILSKRFKGIMRFNMIDKPEIIIPNDNSKIYQIIELFETITSINKGEIYEKN